MINIMILIIPLLIGKNKSLYERARAAIYTDCMCKQNCLATLSPNFGESLLLLQTYMDEWYLLEKKVHHDKFLELLKAQTSGKKFKSRFNWDFTCLIMRLV